MICHLHHFLQSVIPTVSTAAFNSLNLDPLPTQLCPSQLYAQANALPAMIPRHPHHSIINHMAPIETTDNVEDQERTMPPINRETCPESEPGHVAHTDHIAEANTAPAPVTCQNCHFNAARCSHFRAKAISLHYLGPMSI